MDQDDFSDVDLGMHIDGPITANDIGKKVRLLEGLGNQWMTVIKVLSWQEYKDLCMDPEVDFVGNGEFACDGEYLLAKDAEGKRYIWGCNDDWQKGIPM